MKYNFNYNTSIRVRYGETDQMGYCYYGNYAQFFEVGRVEALREVGFSYKDIEDLGFMLPVSEFTVKYIRPAYYDDELIIITEISEIKGPKITFDYKILNAKKELVSSAKTDLVFVKKENMRPCAPPDFFLEKLKPFELK